MIFSQTSLRLIPLVLVVAIACGMAGPARAQDDDSTRSVRIIEGAPGQAAPPVSTPAAPTPPPPVASIDVHRTAIRAENDAGVELSILPDVELAAGTTVSVRVATKKAGYLILIDVDPAGKLTQIYPNRHTLERRDNQEALNLIKAGQVVTIPNQNNPYAGFEFIASPQNGVAMLVAILSDRPVHLIDLPDVSAPSNGQGALDQVSDLARRLRIAREDGSIAPEGPHWSFDAKLYLVK